MIVKSEKEERYTVTLVLDREEAVSFTHIFRCWNNKDLCNERESVERLAKELFESLPNLPV